MSTILQQTRLSIQKDQQFNVSASYVRNNPSYIYRRNIVERPYYYAEHVELGQNTQIFLTFTLG